MAVELLEQVAQMHAEKDPRLAAQVAKTAARLTLLEEATAALNGDADLATLKDLNGRVRTALTWTSGGSERQQLLFALRKLQRRIGEMS